MKIGIDARYLENEMTGIGRYSFNLLYHMLLVDHRNHYHVLVRKDYHGRLPAASNVFYHRVSHAPVSLRTILPVSLVPLIASCDLFHSHFPLIPLIPRTRFIATVHDLQPLCMPGMGGMRPMPMRMAYRMYYHLFYRTTFLRSRALIAVSHATRWYLEAHMGIPRERIHVIHEALDERFAETHTGGDPQNLRTRYRLPDAFLLYVGSTLPHKNLVTLLEAYSRAVRMGMIDGISLIFAGRESRFDIELARMVEKLELGDLVRRIGYVPQHDVSVLYTMAKALVYVTRYEGFGLPPLEAIHHGLPVLASFHASLPEVLGPCCLFVDPDDVESIARGIVTIVNDTDLRKRLSEMGKHHLARFSWHKAARETIRVYEQVYAE